MCTVQEYKQISNLYGIILNLDIQQCYKYEIKTNTYKKVACKWVWKNHDSRPISRFNSEMMQDRAIVTALHQSFRMVPVWMILSDL